MEIDAIYGNQNLKKSLHYKAQTFASSYIENLGNGQFKLSPLPQLAQTSNLNDFMVSDFNKDGHLDVLGVGNLFVSEIETPRNDAGTGTLLLGNGKGHFSVISSKESGIWARGDAKKMIRFKHKGKLQVLVANNSDKLQCFTIK